LRLLRATRRLECDDDDVDDDVKLEIVLNEDRLMPFVFTDQELVSPQHITPHRTAI